MKRLSRLPAAALSFFLLASCVPAVVTPTLQAVPSETPVPHSSEIRLGLVGDATHASVWSLFDEKGQSYNAYAVESGYWPRLYGFSVPGRQFQPQAASGMPSAIHTEGGFYTGTVALRTDLKWSDGSPFTANDVAFTANTVLSFQLGFDWRAFYDPAWLDHVQAIDLHTVKFFFKTKPGVANWQYGALLGPVVQQAYWSPRIADSGALLPSPELSVQIQDLKAGVATLQAQVNAFNRSPATSGDSLEIRQTKSNLDQAVNDLAKAQSEYDNAMQAARQSLETLADDNEPLLGTWQSGRTLQAGLENDVNPYFYFGHPHFDRVIYRVYPAWDAAWAALKSGAVDVVLVPGGVSPPPADLADPVKWMVNPTSSARFLMINRSNPILQNLAVRQALACVIDPQGMARVLNNQAEPLESFVLPAETYWVDPIVSLPCHGLDDTARLAQAVQILNSSGFTWSTPPAGSIPGKGLKTSAGAPFPDLQLLAPSDDLLRAAAAAYVQDRARWLGMPLTARLVSSDTISYAVFSSDQYDLAILGWHLSAYPGYLCDWTGGSPPLYWTGADAPPVSSQCAALTGTSDLQAARGLLFDIQSAYAQDLPLIPLYSLITGDGYRNVSYPFDRILDGLNGSYGAPSLAVPVP